MTFSMFLCDCVYDNSHSYKLNLKCSVFDHKIIALSFSIFFIETNSLFKKVKSHCN